MTHQHHQWLSEIGEAITREYEELQVKVSGKPQAIQQVGHQAEAKWVALLESWLPPAYEVRTRKYLLLEDESGPERSGETDIVVFHPSYPKSLRTKSEVLVSGVVAAFSVKTTLDRPGIESVIQEAAQVKAGVKSRGVTGQAAIETSPIYGLLAHSHKWKAPGSDPHSNVTTALEDFDKQYSSTPRTGLDLVCVADLNAWSRHTFVSLGREYDDDAGEFGNAFPHHVHSGFLSLSPFVAPQTTPIPIPTLSPDQVPPVPAFISSLWRRLSRFHDDLRPFAEGLHATGTGGSGAGFAREWSVGEVFCEDARPWLRSGLLTEEDLSWPG